MKAICLIISLGRGIRLKDNPDNLLSSSNANPEELGDQVSMADMFTYADIVSSGENISKLK